MATTLSCFDEDYEQAPWEEFWDDSYNDEVQEDYDYDLYPDDFDPCVGLDLPDAVQLPVLPLANAVGDADMTSESQDSSSQNYRTSDNGEKRRRLMRKQACDWLAEGVLRDENADGSSTYTAPLLFDSVTHRKMLDKIRYYYTTHGWRQKFAGLTMTQLTTDQLSRFVASMRASAVWRNMCVKMQNNIVMLFDWVLLHGWPKKGRPIRESLYHGPAWDNMKAWAIQLTAQGPWGVIVIPNWRSQMPSRLTDDMVVDELCIILQTWPKVLSLFETWMNFIVKAVGETVWEHMNFTMSAELCVKTLMEQNKIRVHLNAYVEAKQGLVTLHNTLMFHGCKLHMKPTKHGGRRSRAEMCANGHYYLQYPKRGNIIMKTNYERHIDFPVRAIWINQQWQLGKMNDENAVDELVKCGQNVRFHVENVRYCANQRKKINGVH